MTYALAYSPAASVTKKKSFIKFAPEVGDKDFGVFDLGQVVVELHLVHVELKISKV